MKYLIEIEFELMKDFGASVYDLSRMSLIDTILYYNKNVEDKVNKLKAKNNQENIARR